MTGWVWCNDIQRPCRQPRDAICHICGRKYTIHSINIHVPQCQKLFLAQQAKLPRKERKKLPELPAGTSKLSLTQRNEVAQRVYEDSVMEKCPYCGRTFMEGRLEKHIYSCARSHGKEHIDPRFDVPMCYPIGQRREARNTVICYVCGRKYTTHSIGIHLPQCKKLYVARQRKLPLKDRKPLPKEPDPSLPLQQRNEFAAQRYNNCVLEACKYCKRTFFPDRLVVHLRSCKRNHMRKKLRPAQ